MIHRVTVEGPNFGVWLRALAVLTALSAVGLGAEAQRAIHEPKLFQMRAADQTSDPFLAAVPYDTGGPEAWSLAVADLNADGKLDVIVVNNNGYPNTGDSTVGVTLGNGDGTFRPAVVYDAGYGGATSVAVGDLNNDGKPDFVVASAGFVSVFVGNGDGSFQPAVVYASGGAVSFPSSIPLLLDDLNGDGKLDVIVGNQTNQSGGDGAALVLLGKGNGTLSTPKAYDSGGFFMTAVAVADLNSDGIKDIVLLNCAASGSSECSTLAIGSVGVLLGNGDGTFKPIQNYLRGAGGLSWSPVKIADVNGDGKPDILVGNPCKLKFRHEDGYCTNDGSVGVLAGNGDGTFRPVVTFDSGGSDAASIVVTDMDGDGKLDLVVQNGSVPAVLRGNGDGTFLFADRYNPGGIMQGSPVQVADVNGDGIPDLVGFAASSVDVIWVMLGNGSGFTGSFGYVTGYGLSQAVIEDVNGDGKPDLLAVYGCNNSYGCGAADGTLGVQLNNPEFIFNSSITRVTSNAGLVGPNQSVTYAVVVSDPGGNSVTGSVECLDHSKVIADQTLENNQTTFNILYSSAGTHEVQCVYSGNSAHLSSTSLNLSEYVKQLPVGSAMTLATSASPTLVGQPVTFTARVTSKFGLVPNGEPVTFYDGKTVLGTAPLSASTAAFTTSSLSAKKHTIKAVYAGDGSFKGSQKTVMQVVEK